MNLKMDLRKDLRTIVSLSLSKAISGRKIGFDKLNLTGSL
jgi:hypothetical protein